MAKAALESSGYTGRTRKGDAARAALLDAARRLADRDGVDAVTLKAVADEADIAHATAYSYFTSKADLLQSVVADDLGALLHAMREAAGLPQPPRVPPPPSRIVRFELHTVPNDVVDEVVHQEEETDEERDGEATHAEADADISKHEQEQPAAVAAEPVHEDVGFENLEPAVAPLDPIEGEALEEFSAPESEQALKPVVVEPTHDEIPDNLEPAVAPLDPIEVEALEDTSTESEPAADTMDTDIVAAETEVETLTAPHPVAPIESEFAPQSADLDVQTLYDPEDDIDQETDVVADPFAEASAVAASAPVLNAPALDAAPAVVGETEVADPDAPAQESVATDEVNPQGPAEDVSSAVEPVTGSRSDTVAEDAPAEPALDTATPLENRLPAREERIRLAGKRLLGTADLRDTIRKLAPVYTPDGEQPQEAIARLEQSVTKLEHGVEEKLERRIAHLERNLLGLEDRAQKSLESHGATVGELRGDLTTLQSQTRTAAKLHHDTMLKMMAEIRDFMRRLDAMEFARDRSVATDDLAVEAPADLAIARPDDAADATPSVSSIDEVFDNARSEGSVACQDNYLSAARRAAMSAVASELSEPQNVKQDRSRQNRLIAAGAGVGILLLGALVISLRLFAPHGPAMATPRVEHHMAMRTHRLSFAGATPLDKISAEARAGQPDAELTVGLKYLSGDGIPKDENEAAKWIGKAAQSGNVAAIDWLGMLYEHGKGVAADPKAAISLFEKAAGEGNRKAMHDLAIAYAQGTGVALNYFEAARWFSKAASLGYVDSAFNLAVLYERGDGVPQSLLDAYKWYAIAAAEGDQESKTRMEAISSELSSDDLAAAQNAAASFKPAPMTAGASVVANDTPPVSTH